MSEIYNYVKYLLTKAVWLPALVVLSKKLNTFVKELFSSMSSNASLVHDLPVSLLRK